MLRISGTTISMTRGDTARIDLTIYASDGTEYTPEEDDVIKFAVKKDYSDTDELITKYITDGVLEIAPDDTKSLPFGRYVYDIELTTAAGDVDTFIAKATLNICEEVG